MVIKSGIYGVYALRGCETVRERKMADTSTVSYLHPAALEGVCWKYDHCLLAHSINARDTPILYIVSLTPTSEC